MTGRVDARLKDLGIELPSPPPPVASYVPYVIVDNLVYISGQITATAEGLKYIGRLGENVSLDEGKTAARLCAVNVLAQLKVACNDDLDRVRRCVKLGVFVNAVSDFTQHPEVANGASDLIVEVLGHVGKHARSAVGVGSLPRGVACEVDAIFEIE